MKRLGPGWSIAIAESDEFLKNLMNFSNQYYIMKPKATLVVC